jgi:hypothetical protein
MDSPYDLSRGYKGFKLLAAYEQITSLRASAKHIRASNAVNDPLSSDVQRDNALASRLEKKATHLAEQVAL